MYDIQVLTILQLQVQSPLKLKKGKTYYIYCNKI